MRKVAVVSIAVVALLAMMPNAVLAIHVVNHEGTAGCLGFELYAEVIDGSGVLINWSASIQRWDGTSWVEEDLHTGSEWVTTPTFSFPADPPANPDDGLWRSGLPDGEYRAVLEMTAEDGFPDYYEEIPGITLPCSPPTAVTLASFGADAAGPAVVLNWETAAEIDSVGFNVYRAESADGLRTKLNSALIASKAPGSPMGASYQFADDTARAGITYFYWLQELDANGEAAEYGPVSAELEVRARMRLARPRLAPTGGFRLSSD
jgi:hypothetical protein